MLAYDGSRSSDEALAKFAGSPLLKDLPGHLVMVATPTTEHQQQLDSAKHILEKEGRSITANLIQGPVQDALKEYRDNNDIDLMVMGAYGHSRLREFFVGSQTSKMISRSPIPLLLLR